MDEAEFDRRWSAIETGYAERDQRIGKLFAECGWTQQKIADHVGMSQQWVAQQLRFGRFLVFTTAVVNREDLSEWRFRGYWEQTDPSLSEKQRFHEVVRLMGFAPSPGAEPEPVLDAVAVKPADFAQTVAALMTDLGHEDKSGARLCEVRKLVTHGAANVIAMVREGKVKLGPASYYVESVGLREQSLASADEIRRIGYQQKANRSARGASKTKEVKPKKPNFTKRAPLHVDMTKFDIGEERIPFQPVMLQPARIQRLSEDRRLVGSWSWVVASLVNRQINADDYFAACDRMLAYVPVSGKDNGEQEDFAKDARKNLALVDDNINQAIDRLTELRSRLDERRQIPHPNSPRASLSPPGGNPSAPSRESPAP
jgi:hypothetical protein